MENKNDIKALIILANAGYADNVIEIARQAGAMGGTILNGRSEGKTHKSFMGITVDAEIEMVLCVVDEITAKKVMAALKEKAGLNTPEHTMSLTLPVESLVGFNMSGDEIKAQ